MRTLLVLAVFCSAIFPSASGQQLDEKILIAHAKNADVSVMDKTLPKESFADWLTRTVGPTATITWHSNDCGEATGGSGDRNRNLPICIEAAATWPDGRKAVLNLAVGSQKDGLARQPNSFYLLQIKQHGKVEVFRTLGELTARLGKVVQNQPRIPG